MIKQEFLEALRTEIPQLSWQPDAPMSRYTTLRVGGPADCLAEPADRETLQTLLKLAGRFDLPVTVMGNGSNLLVKDGGLRGLVIRLGRAYSACEITDTGVTAQSGILLSDLAQQAANAGLAGLEFAAGIPGALGGAVVMNAGAYGGEIAQRIVSAEVLSGEKVLTLDRNALALSYRHSRMQETGELVLSARFGLTRDDPDAIRARMAELQTRRREKQPLQWPSAGSFFKRPAGAYAAQLIDEAGLKGLRVGGAMVSEKHAGFLINAGGATAADFLSLMRQVQETVYKNSGFRLEPEVRIIGEDA